MGNCCSSAGDGEQDVSISREISSKLLLKPTFADPVQFQSREDFLLKNYTLAIEKDLPSLATSILSFSKDEMNVLAPRRRALPADDSRYIAVKNLFKKTTRQHFPVKIEVAENPFLKAFYLLKKTEKAILYGTENGKEELLFHGTKKENINYIITDNLNWRYHGKAKGHMYGMGVSFSPISNYSTHYCDRSVVKVMILALVLVSRECVGNQNMVIPPCIDRSSVRYDSSTKPNRAVIVKYSDDEFYPNYIIHFKDYKKFKNHVM